MLLRINYCEIMISNTFISNFVIFHYIYLKQIANLYHRQLEHVQVQVGDFKLALDVYFTQIENIKMILKYPNMIYDAQK